MGNPERHHKPSEDEAPLIFDEPPISYEHFQHLRESIDDDAEFVDTYLIAAGISANDEQRAALVEFAQFSSSLREALLLQGSEPDLQTPILTPDTDRRKSPLRRAVLFVRQKMSYRKAGA
ncbi:hypothetical protein ACHBTE_32210 [Streptomyces sp. M41]|uniref:hypothetical protein n=1 Tax=Streptomyces sp. M41 TaxID=3059412 RepID=UPI00374D1EC7